jgi:hypothetical protein
MQDGYYYFKFGVNDIDDNQVFAWQLNTNAPWLSIGKDTGVLSGIPKNDHVGSYFVNATVKDKRGGRTSYNFTMVVENVNDPPQWVRTPQDTVVKEGDRISFDVDALDIDDGDLLTYGIATKPMTDISIGQMTGTITWTASLDFFTPPYNVLLVTVNATDGEEEIEFKFSISVVENSTLNPSSNSNDKFDSTTPLIVLSSVFLILIAILIVFIVVRMKTMDSSEEKTVTTVLFGSKKKVVMKDIFISYAHSDGDIAFKICDDLEKHGYGCWIAPRDITPGHNWGKAIIQGINNSRLMIMVFSEDSNQSVQVLREIERAVHKKIPIVLFRISDIDPSEDFEYYVSAVHWLNAVGGPIEGHIDQLREIVQATFSEMEDGSETEE